MALTDFFRINLPYGIERNDNNEWFAFNREYMPLGWHTKSFENFDEKQHELISQTYTGMTEALLLKLANPGSVDRDKNGKIYRIWFYNDRTNPMNDSKEWDVYLSKLKRIATLKVGSKNKKHAFV
jgi:hypothetical protein